MYLNLFLGSAFFAAVLSTAIVVVLGLQLWHGVVLCWLIASAMMLGRVAWLAAEGRLEFGRP